ncbi:DNA (cytosine-5)-methyltransferase CMT3-like [Rosa sericea]
MATKRKSKRSPASSSAAKKLKQVEKDVLLPEISEIETETSTATKAKRSKAGSSSASAKLKEPAVVVVEEDSVLESTETAEKVSESSETATMAASVPKSRKYSKKESKESGGSEANNVADEDVVMSEARFLGEPVEPEEARRRWPHRYAAPRTQKKTNNSNDDEDFLEGRRHFTKAEVDGCIYDLYDDAHVKAGKGEQPYICKIIEMFEAVDGLPYFTAQWFYRAKDTVIEGCFDIDSRRVFYSDVMNYNELECLLGKLDIARFGLDIDPDVKCKLIESCTYYCDTKYLLPYSTFVNFPPENMQAGSDNSSTISSEIDISCSRAVNSELEKTSTVVEQGKPEATVLDLYSGCGGMSTGLCLGANSANLNLVTRWAVDLNEHAIKSLKINHEETEVRVESADDFLSLLKKWKGLCVHFKVVKPDGSETVFSVFTTKDAKEEEEDVEAEDDDDDAESEVYEVEKILGIRYGKAKNGEEKELLFKVKWKGYGAEYDTWEPLDLLTGCEETIQEFVSHVYQSKLLPLPGDVDVVCGGPPCQGISGFNRFRNSESPLDDEKNKQLAVFMDIVDYLKPKYVLMENVVDLLKFADGFLGRYALGRLVGMNYQARMGMMCAGAYGLPQFRMRVFYWGALPTERLPQFPLPTHDVVFRGQIPTKWEQNCVAYNEGHDHTLGRKLLLEDALSDLPEVGNNENRDVMPYGKQPQTEFQKFIRLSKDGFLGISKKLHSNEMLYDHRPLKLNADDHERVCRVPKEKGANFRNLPGVLVGADNKVMWDPEVERVLLKSGKPLVPDYAMSFVKGHSSKPFGRLWWDEIVSTVVTRAEPHNQAILHPQQDRVLTVRENARLQGFPDYYQLSGPIKERYMQIGNAVAVPVSRALGYTLGLAYKGSAGEDSLFELPKEMHLPNGCFEDGDYV